MYKAESLAIKHKRIKLVIRKSLYAKCHRSVHFSGQRIQCSSASHFSEDRSYHKLNCIIPVINFLFFHCPQYSPPLKLIAHHIFPFTPTNSCLCSIVWLLLLLLRQRASSIPLHHIQWSSLSPFYSTSLKH